jgi:hypothetical protein
LDQAYRGLGFDGRHTRVVADAAQEMVQNGRVRLKTRHRGQMGALIRYVDIITHGPLPPQPFLVETGVLYQHFYDPFHPGDPFKAGTFRKNREQHPSNVLHDQVIATEFVLDFDVVVSFSLVSLPQKMIC